MDTNQQQPADLHAGDAVSLTVNAATGEVSLDLSGQPFRLHATMARVAALQAALGEKGFAGLSARLANTDAGAIVTSLKTLCSSGNPEVADSVLFAVAIKDGVDAIFKALAAGLPEPEPGNAEAARAPVPT